MAAGLAGLWLAGCATRPVLPEPGNLSEAKRVVRAYVDSGDYERALAELATEASAWIRHRAEQRGEQERLVVVFDVDETVLSNLPHMRAMDFGYIPEAWNRWVEQGVAPALVPMREVYAEALRVGVDVVFITGRLDPRDREGTERNLREQGFGRFLRLILARPEEQELSTTERKRRARESLAREGWVVIASIGDQWSDLEGGHAERLFKVPNPFYRIP